MSTLEAFILGLVQGLTEFLPVSSSGHLEIFNHLLGVNPENNLMFAITVHGGTVLSTIVVFRKQLAQLLKGFFQFRMNPETQFVLKLLLSLIPILIVGFTLRDFVEGFFGGNLLMVGCMLLLTALLLWFSYRAKPRTHEVSYRDAFIIGIAQALAVLPGLSRSGSTISTGLLLGVKREEAASFSFLMVLIPIIGVNLLDLLKGDLAASPSVGALPLLVGFLTSFITGVLACRWMIRLVNKGKLVWFALYCLIVGSVSVVYSLCAA